MAATAELSQKENCTLIHLYHHHPALWDTTSKAYKDQNVRATALKAIEDEFFRQHGVFIGINAIKTKLQSFRTRMGKELALIEQSMRSGAGTDDIYVSKYRHFRELQFLTRVIKKRASKTNVEDQCSTSCSTPIPEPSLLVETEMEDLEAEELALPCHPPEHWDSQSSSHSPPLLLALPPEPSESGTANLSFIAPTSSPTPTHTDTQLNHSQTKITNLRKKTRHDKEQDGSDAALSDFASYLKSKMAKKERTEEDPLTTWAKNLVNDLRAIKSEKTRKIMQIQISRQVQDQLLKEFEQEDKDDNERLVSL